MKNVIVMVIFKIVWVNVVVMLLLIFVVYAMEQQQIQLNVAMRFGLIGIRMEI